MKQFFIPGVAVVAIFLATAALPAQETVRSAHSLMEDAWALQFAIGEKLALGEFAGGVISAKHHRAEARALRYGLSLAAGHTAGRSGTSDRTDAMVGLVVHFLRYPTLVRDPGSDLHMFWGFGPLVRFQTQRISPPDQGAFTSHLLSMGAGGTIGAEWFVRPRISLSAEYQSALTVSYLSDSSPDAWGVRLAQDGVLFGVSLYFR
jgi:hypothetical protein